MLTLLMAKNEAYATFTCTKSLAEIAEWMPVIEGAVQLPSDLELHLIDANKAPDVSTRISPGVYRMGTAQRIPEEVLRQAWDGKQRYVFKAVSDTLPSRDMAAELELLVNQTYQSPLYKEGEAFQTTIFREEGNDL